MDMSGALPTPTGGEEDDPESDKPKTVPPKIGNLPPEFKPSARDAWAQGFQDALKELEQEAIWKTKKGQRILHSSSIKGTVSSGMNFDFELGTIKCCRSRLVRFKATVIEDILSD